jgi:hypothetical protein
MARVNQTRPHSENQTRKTQSKLLAARHGRANVFVNYPLAANLYKSAALIVALQFCLQQFEHHAPLSARKSRTNVNQIP